MGAIRITGTVVNPQALKFIDFFTKRHPLDKDVHFHFEDAELLPYNLGNANGLCSVDKRCPEVKIQIAAKGNLSNKKMGMRWNLATLAHEYKHALQAYRDKKKFKKGWDSELELEAGWFGVHEVDAAIAEGVIELTQHN